MINIINIKNNLDNVTFLVLLVSMLAYWISISFSKFKNGAKIGYYCVCLSNLLITLILGSRWLTNGYFPLSNLYESLLFFVWGITFINALIEYKKPLPLVGAISTPLSLFVVAFATLSLPEGMQKAAPLVPALKSNWLMMHVSIMMLSYSTLIIGSLLSILFLVLTSGKDVNLQGSSIGAINFPNDNTVRDNSIAILESVSTFNDSLQKTKNKKLNLLESLDNLSYRIIGLGFPLLTIGIIAGAVWANEAWGAYWSWDPKETWALITWLVFAAYLHARITKAWQGKKPAILASIGFVVVWICYLGVNFLGKGLHSYGWIM
uniref:Cytochrome c biogenesis protein CcsA n=1 Tax=Storeatula sp. CCMP1868 TaxID=195070 RepID=A0A222AHN6_9CRYP|nr:cytochrome c biogenesis protein [Storeatula sp. CCMP1868]